MHPGMLQRLRIVASDVSVVREAPRSSTVLDAFSDTGLKLVFRSARRETPLLALGTGGSSTDILARMTRCSFDTLGLKDGMDVFAQLKYISLASGL